LDSTTKDLIKAYLEKADQKLAVARRLLAASDNDDAVSRAYYTMQLSMPCVRLKDDREAADYELFANVDHTLAETAIMEADRLLAEATGYLRREGFID
jgi:uncharacterized protein (UPF0332 family)